jgi:hypothetical protein
MGQINTPPRVGDVGHGGRPSRRGTDQCRQQEEPRGTVEQDCVAVREFDANCRRSEFFNLRSLRSPPGVRLRVLCVALSVPARHRANQPSGHMGRCSKAYMRGRGLPLRWGERTRSAMAVVRRQSKQKQVHPQVHPSDREDDKCTSSTCRRPGHHTLSTGGALTMLPTSLAGGAQNSGWIDRSIVNSSLKLCPSARVWWCTIRRRHVRESRWTDAQSPSPVRVALALPGAATGTGAAKISRGARA